MDEIFEVLTLIQTGKLPSRPVVCMGKDYWAHMQNFLRETMLKAGAISPEDLDLAFVTDDPLEAMKYIQDRATRKLPAKDEYYDPY